MLRKLVYTLTCLPLATAASAQNFTQSITFGDSSVDSGYYRGLNSPGGGAAYNALWAAAVAAGAGKPGGPGQMASESLASRFGLSANPSNTPGGTNYATSGARSNLPNGPGSGLFNAAVPMTRQINNYLASVNGQANANGLYLISGGGNDVGFAQDNLPAAASDIYIQTQANALANAVQTLRNAGARYFIVPNQAYSFPNGGGAGNAEARRLKLESSYALWNDLAARGVNFIPADVNAVRLAIRDNPAAFGFEFIDTALGHTACTKPAGIGSAWGLLCSANPGAPSQLIPGADQTRLFADDQHLSAAGQKIMADYFYSLVVAPSQISMLAEHAVKSRARNVQGIQQQIELSGQEGHHRHHGMNMWVNGDVSHLAIKNYDGFPDDPGTPVMITVGADYRVAHGLLVGAALSINQSKADFNRTGGDFKQNETAVSVYAATTGQPLWASVIGTWGKLDYDVNRQAAIGITVQSSRGSTDGRNRSLALESGYKFKSESLGGLTHGPVAGLVLQDIKIGGFTETGSFTSLAFGEQTRHSAVLALGYRASLDLGAWKPFAQATWNHELANTERDIMASITTSVAPSYTMPGVVLGKDWANVTVGSTFKLGNGMTALGSVSADLAQKDVTNVGARLGLNVPF
jgi:outer membrane lipase/esterase